ncbi:MAG: hypothetical protein JWN56_2347 [Sphingobacteriales bacterium]|nr:hypothetical protein [Sphingobacteriales bacterium]
MKLKLILFSYVLLLTNQLFAQHARFTTEGTIEYEKRVNMPALIKKLINKDNESFLTTAYEDYKKNQPQFKVLKSTLNFANGKTLFVPVVEPTVPSNGFFNDLPATSQNNIIYTDLSTSTSITQKKVFEETFLVKDSTRKITWKITSETKEIAGYTCRRANALILDSVYVVAFYTDKIAVSGGPESFSGLPGMILGVALPHDNITWFATSVVDKPLSPNIMKVPIKGKVKTNKELKETLTSVMKNWGNYAQMALKAFML